MISFLKKDRWSPYLVGLLIGILLTSLFAIGYQFGVSSGVARISALIENIAAPEHIAKTPYFNKLLGDGIFFNWKILFIIGLFLGSYVASKITDETIPPKNTIWKEAFGPSNLKRYIAAFIGGALLLFGARIADGCTSGHAISGGAQLSVVSWVFMLALFATAIPTSFIMYGKNRRQ